MTLRHCWCGELHAGKRHPRPRPTSHQRGYDAAWRVLRREVLDDEPFCRACGSVATDVDHIMPRRRGGSDDRTNLQSLCHRCHSAKTMRGL